MGTFIQRDKGGLFTQVAPDEAFTFLTKVGVGAITVPKPDREARYDPHPQAGKFRIAGFIQGEPGEGSVTLTRPLATVANFLLEQNCPFQGLVSIPCRGGRNLFSNYWLQILLFQAQFESGEIEESVVIEPGDNDRIMTNGDLVAADVKLIYSVDGSAQTTTTTSSGYAIAVLPEQCESECADLIRKGEVAWGALVSAGYLAADSVIYTEDFGSTWTATSADPFDGNRNCTDVLLIPTSNDAGYRVIVAGGADPGHHAEISYSDDKGVSWTDVEVGAMNGQAINGLTIDYQGRIWAIATDGMLYRSDDNGASWSLIDSSTTSEDLNEIVFYDEYTGMAVGDTNAVVVTSDGGDTWTSVTGPAVGSDLYCVDVNYFGHFYVGASDDAIYRTTDDGDNWTSVNDFGTGSIKAIDFEGDLDYGGWMVRVDGDGDGFTYRSRDGGVSWDLLDTIANSGLEDIAAVDFNEAFEIGDAHGGTTFVAHYAPAS